MTDPDKKIVDLNLYLPLHYKTFKCIGYLKSILLTSAENDKDILYLLKILHLNLNSIKNNNELHKRILQI